VAALAVPAMLALAVLAALAVRRCRIFGSEAQG